MQNTPFETIVSALTHDQNPRVWSLLVSVFGELAQDDGSKISGTLLRQLTQDIGIKPEAMRVAIHRLRKEGWIDSERDGRNSVYFLTPWGRAQSAAASPRIYATTQAADAAWMAFYNPARPAQSGEPTGVWVSTNVLICADDPTDDGVFVTPLRPQTQLPDWMAGKICDDQAVQMSEEFSIALGHITRQLPATRVLQPREIAVLRVLLVHGWRRIILKTPLLPDYVFPTAWSGPKCRAMVTDLLAQYPNPGLAALEPAADTTKAGPKTASAQS